MKNIYETLNGLTYDDYKMIFEEHLEWAKDNDRGRGLPQWWNVGRNGLNIIGVRCNTEVDFNFGKYNDYLVLIFNKDITILNVTVDPGRNKNGIAHLRQGMWNSYVIRPHRWAKRSFPGIGEQYRWAICQDKHTVQIVRTDGKGKVISNERGMYGINIHDSGGYNDSSLGCTVIQSDTSYVDLYLPLLYDIHTGKEVPVNHEDLTYCLINFSQLEKYIGGFERVTRGDAENGIDVRKGESKGATAS